MQDFMIVVVVVVCAAIWWLCRPTKTAKTAKAEPKSEPASSGGNEPARVNEPEMMEVLFDTRRCLVTYLVDKDNREVPGFLQSVDDDTWRFTHHTDGKEVIIKTAEVAAVQFSDNEEFARVTLYPRHYQRRQ